MDSVARKFDLTMLYAAYDAFRRDAARLEAAALAVSTSGWAPAARSWPLFTSYWSLQERAEKNALWTVMYAKDTYTKDTGGSGRVGAVLDAMASLALRTVPLVDGVDAALEHRDPGALAGYARDLRASVDALLDFKESDVLPLIQEALTPFEWGTFEVELRRELGLRGLGVFLPWLLDGAPEATRRAVLGLLPPPLRLLYRARWRPRYLRRTRVAPAPRG
ncbi:hemerythrin domain-containing protein [Actinomadura sp. DSM 109109]|nr:hemerythrin domain-containing protein [Actinomadura lepetitiana]